MGISVLPNRFQFNGVISTDLTVLQNLETMCRAAGSYFTYDSGRGQWAVIINRETASSHSFDDSNIIGSISLSSTGLDELYNSVRVSFPHQDLNDVRDFVRYAIATNDRFPNEADNELLVEYDIFNDPVQADILAITELKQNRRDLAIQFTTNFNSIGIVPGHVIDITSEMYGFAQRKFRVISVTEADTDDGNIVLDISAIEYDDDVYDLSDLFRFERSAQNGITTPGDLAAPPVPELTITQVDSRPRVVVTALVPGNARVERMEFWYSTNNVNFEKVGTVTPQGGSGAFVLGAAVAFEFVPPVSGAMQFRVRAGNATTTGLFSGSVSDTFSPTQVTDAIGPNTEILDNNNESIARQLALSALLSALDGFLDGNSDMSEVFDQVFDEAFEESAADLPGGAGLLTTGTIAVDQQSFDPAVTINGPVVTIDRTVSRVLIIAENNSGGVGASATGLQNFEIKVFKNGIDTQLAPDANGLRTGFTGDIFDDLNLQTTVDLALAPGDTLQLKFVVDSDVATLAVIGWAVFDASGVN